MTVIAIIAAIQAAVKAGVEVAPLIIELANTFKDGKEPPEGWDAYFAEMRKREGALSARIQKPLPPEEA